jgi:hypothetical protein
MTKIGDSCALFDLKMLLLTYLDSIYFCGLFMSKSTFWLVVSLLIFTAHPFNDVGPDLRCAEKQRQAALATLMLQTVKNRLDQFKARYKRQSMYALLAGTALGYCSGRLIDKVAGFNDCRCTVFLSLFLPSFGFVLVQRHYTLLFKDVERHLKEALCSIEQGIIASKTQ